MAVLIRSSRLALAKFVLSVAGASFVAACGTLPYDGPTVGDVRSEWDSNDKNTKPFELVKVSPATIAALARRPDATLSTHFGGDTESLQDLPVGRGDSVVLSIWETGSDTLFSGSSGSSAATGSPSPPTGGSHEATIPAQIVGQDGKIMVPFAGRVMAAGRTPLEIQKDVEHVLAGKTARPQVLVSVAHGASSSVTVVGEASTGGTVGLTAHNERLLDVLAASGSTHLPAYQTLVQLTRNSKSVAVPLSRIISDRRENIVMRPGDSVAVTHIVPTFTVFGASSHNGQVLFTQAQVSLVEAVAMSGGILDSRADPTGVFVFRYEPRAIAQAVGNGTPIIGKGGLVPVVYQVDFTKVGSYFTAQNFLMQDRDILFVSSAPSNQLQKFLLLLGLITQPATSGVLIDNALK